MDRLRDERRPREIELSSSTPISDVDSSAEDEVAGFGDLLCDSPTNKSLLQKGGDCLGMEDDEGPVEYKWKLVNVSDDRLEHLVTQMKFRIAEGQGECMYEIGVDNDGFPKGLDDDEYEESVNTVKRMAGVLECDVSLVCEKVVQTEPVTLRCCELMIRKLCRNNNCLDLRIAICGNVDSGKSTLTGVLTTGMLDNGRGSMRQSVFKHKHEIDTGRTSSISQQIIGYDAQGSVVNYKTEGGGFGHVLSNHQIAEVSSKIVTLFDLAGHERYLKTTVFGMTGSIPDYAALVLSANNGVQRMTKEHLGLCLALKMPVFGVITRIDAAPDAVFRNTLADFKKILKMPGVKKLPYIVKSEEDVVVCAKNIKNDRVAPIFCVSNVTGEGLALLKRFVNLLPMRRDWNSTSEEPAECLIDNTFFVTGVGTVVSGVVTKGTIHNGDTILLGPDGHGAFKQIIVKGIHVRGLPVKSVKAGTTGSFALKKEKRSHIRKGMVILGKDHTTPSACWEFEAEVVVLFHSTTIHSNYQPVVHCRTVRQSAKIILVSQDNLRTGDKATVRFRFLYRPEYIAPGSKLIFREGRTKGLGTVTKVTSLVVPVAKSAHGHKAAPAATKITHPSS